MSTETMTMRKARVLIVDDSTVVRRLLSDALAHDPAIEVVGSAANGRIALEKAAELNPDIVTLDIEMPEMDGLAALAELRKRQPQLPVIMFSTMTQRGAVSTLDALSLGAADYVTKPANVGSVMAAMKAVQNELIPKIKALCRIGQHAGLSSAPPQPKTQLHTATPGMRLQRFDCLAIGVSTGGPSALDVLLRALPSDFPLPIVIVQHMPPVFTTYLAQRLNSISSLPIHEAQCGDELSPGQAWLAPGNFHMTVVRGPSGHVVRLNQAEPENSCRPAVDALFRSVADVFGSAALALVLTGMGHDGRNGCEAIRGKGGRILVQDQATSIVWGMPRAVVEAGLADLVLPLPDMATELTALARQRRIRPLKTLAASAPA